MRRALRLTLRIILGLIAVPLLLLLFVLSTTTGARWVLGLALPEPWQVGTLDGSLLSGLQARDISGPGLSIEQAEVNLGWAELLRLRPAMNLLHVSGVRITPDDFPRGEPAPSSDAPFVLPDFSLRDVLIERIEVALTEQTLKLDELKLGEAQSRDGRLSIREFAGAGPLGSMSLNGGLGDADGTLAGSLTLDQVALTFDLSGDPRKTLGIDIRATAPIAAQLRGELYTLTTTPRYDVVLTVPETSGESIGADALQSVAATVALTGDLERVKTSGDVAVDGAAYVLNGDVALGETGLLIDGLTLMQGERTALSISGNWPTAANQPDGDVAVEFDGFAVPTQPIVLERGTAALRGTPEQLGFDVDGQISAQGFSRAVELSGTFGAQQLKLDPLRIADSKGSIAGTLALGLDAPKPISADLVLDGFDLSPFLPDWPSRLNGPLRIEGALDESVTVNIEGIEGFLRAAPFAASGTLSYTPGTLPKADMQLRFGDNDIDIVSESDDRLLAKLRLNDLSLVHPDLRGGASGTIKGNTEEIAVNLAGEQFGYLSNTFKTLTIEGTVRRDLSLIDLQATAREVSGGALPIGVFDLRVDGSGAQHEITAQISNERGTVELAMGGSIDATNTWIAKLNALSIVPSAASDSGLALRDPTRFEISANSQNIAPLCLGRDDTALCIEGNYSATGPSTLTVKADNLDLALAASYWRGSDEGLSGRISGSAAANFKDGKLTTLAGEFNGTGLQAILPSDSGPRTIALSRFQLTVDGDAENLRATLDGEVVDAGPITATVSGIGSEQLEGRIAIDFTSLDLLNGLTDEVADVKGQLGGEIAFNGPPDRLQFGGEIRLTGFAAELPGAGLKLTDGDITLRVPDPDSLSIIGQVRSGEGVAVLNGSLSRRGESFIGEATLQGERITLVDLPKMRLVATPDIKIASDGKRYRATGSLDLPAGLIDLESFEPAVSPSADVVVTDRPVESSTPIDSDIRYSLGPDLKLKGFGLDSELRGKLRITSRANRPTTARGSLTLVGGYKAYGQDLSIERGRLFWTGSPIANPAFDFAASRKIDSITAGVRVRGNAQTPILSVYTDPPRETADALSYVVLGRPLSSASGNDGDKLSAAAGALGSVGGSLLGATIGKQLGVEVGVETPAQLGGSPALTVGKFLNPKLFVGFGQSLFDAGQLIILRYRLTDQFEAEVTSGQETRGGVNYRTER